MTFRRDLMSILGSATNVRVPNALAIPLADFSSRVTTQHALFPETCPRCEGLKHVGKGFVLERCGVVDYYKQRWRIDRVNNARH